MARKRKQGGKTNNAAMPVMRPDAAGIDIGATEIFVAVPVDRAAENVRSFVSAGAKIPIVPVEKSPLPDKGESRRRF